MASEPSSKLRIIVPLVVLALGLLVTFAIIKGPAASLKQHAAAQTAPALSTQAPTGGTPASQPSPATSSLSPPPSSLPSAQASTALPAQWTLSPMIFTTLANTQPAPIGSKDQASGAQLFAEFTPAGAGVKSLVLTQHLDKIKDGKQLVAQEQLAPLTQDASSIMVPFAALALEVTPQSVGSIAQQVNLFAHQSGSVWRFDPSTPGEFEAMIVDDKNTPVLRVVRTYSLAQGSSALVLSTRVENLSPFTLAVRWFQMGPVELWQDSVSYGGDRRHLRLAHLVSPKEDPTRAVIHTKDFNIARADVLGKRDSSGLLSAEISTWPNSVSEANAYELVWAAFTNRYFAVAVVPALSNPADAKSEKGFAWAQRVVRTVADQGVGAEKIGLRYDSKPVTLLPVGPSPAQGVSSTTFAMAIYAGPMDSGTTDKEPLLNAMKLRDLPVANFGGPCGFCTFDTMTGIVLGLLRFLHDKVLHDWALSIIFLVVIVRGVLHPITKWSQIRVQRFGKQMSALGPKQKILQEKYKGDPKQQQLEIARLMKEEGVSPAGMLGCLPMFLQTPVWLSLSAGLYFTPLLRHEGAFYGVFQNIQPRSSPFWQFLGDLAEPDRLLYAGRTLVTLTILGPINALNILPIILGVVFYLQQKLTPATTPGSMTPEQELQMKMMKWMTVFMFPLFMYAAPSGLAIYFIANSILAILESKWIKRHIDKHGLLDLDKIKAEKRARQAGKPVGGEGLFEKAMRMAQDRERVKVQNTAKKK